MSNNRFLLDTHAFLWLMEQNKRFSKDIRIMLQDPENQIFLSVASIWEIVIKKKKGLKAPKNIVEDTKNSGINILAIETSHVLGVEKLQDYHKDPFDRLLIAQSTVEKLTIITNDPFIWKYDINTLRC